MEKSYQNMTMGISLGLCFGTAVGGLLGQLLGADWSTGSLYGCAVGMMLGIAVGTAMDNRVNSRKQNCTIQDIAPEGEGFTVTLRSEAGETLTAALTAEDMAASHFQPGDRVCLDGEGKISPMPQGKE